MTKLGYIKRMTVDNFKSQHRGGKGIKGMQTIEDDYIEDLFMTTTHHYIMFFTNTGRVYRMKAYEIPEVKSEQPEELLSSTCCSLRRERRSQPSFRSRNTEMDRYLFMATKNGMVKKTTDHRICKCP